MKFIKRKYSFLIIAFIAILFSCTKEITVDVPLPEEKIVVEGWIEQGKPASVVITKNSPYFDTVNINTLIDMFVKDAKVTLSDGTNTEELVYTMNGFTWPLVYYKGNTILGEVGKTYSITVEANGKTLTSTTTIPQPMPLDSVWFKLDVNQDSLGYAWFRITDPANEANFYRIFTKRIGKDPDFVPDFGSVTDDKYFNGLSFDFNLLRGETSYTNPDNNHHERGYFKLGDTIVIRFCSIDKDHFDFWRAAEQAILTGSNPFVTPASIPTNIQGGGLGIWGGYGATYDTVIAK
jgi:hypothetical protein